MTDTMTYDGDTILLQKTYPPEWTKWLNKPNGLFTNRELLENPDLLDNPHCDIYDDWFNPFTEPEKLAQERLQLKMRPLAWKRYCEEHYPGIDIQEQHRIRKVEQKQEDIAACGRWRYKKSIYRPGQTERQQWFCNRKECPICRQRRLKDLEDRFKGIDGKVYRVTPEQAKEIKATRTKEEYEQINDEETGEGYLILRKGDLPGIEVEETLDLDYKMIKKLAETALACDHRRVSGKLSQVVEEKETEEGERAEIKRKVYEVEFKKGKNHQQIDKMVLERYTFDNEAERTPEFLQQVIKDLEKLTFEIIEEHCEEIHFLYIETNSVSMSQIDWSLLEKVPRPG